MKELDPNSVQNVELTNPIDYGTYNAKEIILDIKVTFNNSDIMDIELQMYYDAYWKERSVLYLCRTYDTLGKGDDYKLLKPATFVAIMPKSPFPEHPEFYAKFLLLNTKYHYPYTSNFRLNVLDLSQIEIAMDEDYNSGLVHWAKLFLANTWEELNQIASGNPVFEEVLDHMYTINTIPQERTLFEAHQKYLSDMASLRSEKDDTAVELAETKAKLTNTEVELSQSKAQNEQLRQLLLENGIDPGYI